MLSEWSYTLIAWSAAYEDAAHVAGASSSFRTLARSPRAVRVPPHVSHELLIASGYVAAHQLQPLGAEHEVVFF